MADILHNEGLPFASEFEVTNRLDFVVRPEIEAQFRTHFDTLLDTRGHDIADDMGGKIRVYEALDRSTDSTVIAVRTRDGDVTAAYAWIEAEEIGEPVRRTISFGYSNDEHNGALQYGADRRKYLRPGYHSGSEVPDGVTIPPSQEAIGADFKRFIEGVPRVEAREQRGAVARKVAGKLLKPLISK